MAWESMAQIFKDAASSNGQALVRPHVLVTMGRERYMRASVKCVAFRDLGCRSCHLPTNGSYLWLVGDGVVP